MKRIFVTYGNAGFEKAKQRILREALSTGAFDEVYAYGPEDVTPEVRMSGLFSESRGGGYWSWKPDVVLTTMQSHGDGDLIVYCDAGCSLFRASEWRRYWQQLTTHDIIAQRLLQPNECWTRKELVEYFSCLGESWLTDCQYLSGIIFFKNTEFSRTFVREWRDTMLAHPEFVMDVPASQLITQHPSFFQSRHDQSVFSALLYKYLAEADTRPLIATQWEHVEFYDIFVKQAIRATRLRHGESETFRMKLLAAMRRIKLDFLLKPLWIIRRRPLGYLCTSITSVTCSICWREYCS